MLNELTNEITRLMDEHIKDNWKSKSLDFSLNVYVFSKKNDNGEREPVVLGSDNEETYVWFLRYPGYTCGNIIINKKDNTIKTILLTRRGGAFSGGDETVFNDPDKLEKILNDKYRGKQITNIPFDELNS